MTLEEQAVKLKEVEERSKGNSRRIDRLEEDVREISDVVGVLQAMKKDLEYLSKNMDETKNDVKTIMAEQGKAMMGTAVATGSDRAVTAAQEAVSSPLLDGINLSGARGVLVNITASKSLKGKEIRQVMAVVREFASPEATIVQGVAFDDSMGDDLRVTVVATGLDKPSVAKAAKQEEAPAPAAAAAPAAAPASQQPAAEAPAEVPPVDLGKSVGDVVQQLKEGGMDTYDIPAFLRNQMK